MARSWPRLVEKELSEIACERRCCVEEWRGVCASSSSSMLLAGRLRRCDDMVKINGMVTIGLVLLSVQLWSMLRYWSMKIMVGGGSSKTS